MKSAQFKDFYREIKGTLNRFLSIFAIVMLGVAFFVGLKATPPDMRYTADKYYDDHNMMDIQVMSTLGLTEDDVKELEAIDGVDKVQGGYFTDVVTTIGNSEIVIKIHSLPADYLKGEDDNCINQVNLVQGRLPENPGECVIEATQNYYDLGFDIGDRIKVESGTKEKITDSVLKTDEFLVVGKVNTPYYLTYNKGTSTIGDGSVRSFIMISEKDFAYEVYTEILATVDGAKGLNCFEEEYTEKVAAVNEKIEAISDERAQARVDDIKDIYYAQLEDAEKELKEKEALFRNEIAAAEAQLASGLEELNQGQATLDSERESFYNTYSSGQQQIADAENQLAAAEAEYQAGLAEYNEAKENYQDILNMANESEPALASEYENAYSNLNEINSQLASPDLTAEERSELEAQASYYEQELSLVAEGYDYISVQTDSAEEQLSSAEQQLAEARAELDAAQAELADAKAQLASGKEQAESEFAAGEDELAAGRAEYESGKSQLESEKASGEQQLEDARRQLAMAKAEIEKLENPDWYVLNRNHNSSYVDYSMTLHRLDAIANICPTFFMLVAALVCLTTMTRMIDEQRGTIGTYKALGYANKEIVKKYLLYAALASFLGGILGLALGLAIFPETVFNAWSMMYAMPNLSAIPQIPLMLYTLAISIVVMIAASYIACQKELRTTPSLLMRPKPPKAGKTIMLEHVRFLWKRLSFSQKVTARNIFRYKNRFYMTVIGVAGCTALLLAGFGLSDSVGQIVAKQFKQIFQFNIDMKYSAETAVNDKLAIEKQLTENESVGSFIEYSSINATVTRSDKDEDSEEESVTLMVPADASGFDSYVLLRERNGQKVFSLPKKGIVLTEKLTKELGVGIGDTVLVTNADDVTKEIEITGITENYIFHYAYMDYDFYDEVYGYKADMNGLLIKLVDSDTDLESKIGSELIAKDIVSSVIYYSGYAESFKDQISSINTVVWLIIICAALLAFIVLYNLTNINISERIREIATIKVLGFTHREVTAYVFRENYVLTAVGGLLGLGLGVVLHRILMNAIEQEGIMFGYSINVSSFIISFLLTIIFAVIVSVVMYRRLVKIPMVESLKTIE